MKWMTEINLPKENDSELFQGSYDFLHPINYEYLDSLISSIFCSVDSTVTGCFTSFFINTKDKKKLIIIFVEEETGEWSLRGIDSAFGNTNSAKDKLIDYLAKNRLFNYEDILKIKNEIGIDENKMEIVGNLYETVNPSENENDLFGADIDIPTEKDEIEINKIKNLKLYPVIHYYFDEFEYNKDVQDPEHGDNYGSYADEFDYYITTTNEELTDFFRLQFDKATVIPENDKEYRTVALKYPVGSVLFMELLNNAEDITDSIVRISTDAGDVRIHFEDSKKQRINKLDELKDSIESVMNKFPDYFSQGIFKESIESEDALFDAPMEIFTEDDLEAAEQLKNMWIYPTFYFYYSREDYSDENDGAEFDQKVYIETFLDNIREDSHIFERCGVDFENASKSYYGGNDTYSVQPENPINYATFKKIFETGFIADADSGNLLFEGTVTAVDANFKATVYDKDGIESLVNIRDIKKFVDDSDKIIAKYPEYFRVEPKPENKITFPKDVHLPESENNNNLGVPGDMYLEADNKELDLERETKEEAFLDAANKKDFNTVKYYIDRGVDINASYGYTGWTALMFACLYRNIEMVKLLLSHGADPTIKVVELDGHTIFDALKLVRSTPYSPKIEVLLLKAIKDKEAEQNSYFFTENEIVPEDIYLENNSTPNESENDLFGVSVNLPTEDTMEKIKAIQNIMIFPSISFVYRIDDYHEDNPEADGSEGYYTMFETRMSEDVAYLEEYYDLDLGKGSQFYYGELDEERYIDAKGIAYPAFKNLIDHSAELNDDVARFEGFETNVTMTFDKCWTHVDESGNDYNYNERIYKLDEFIEETDELIKQYKDYLPEELTKLVEAKKFNTEEDADELFGASVNIPREVNLIGEKIRVYITFLPYYPEKAYKKFKHLPLDLELYDDEVAYEEYRNEFDVRSSEEVGRLSDKYNIKLSGSEWEEDELPVNKSISYNTLKQIYTDGEISGKRAIKLPAKFMNNMYVTVFRSREADEAIDIPKFIKEIEAKYPPLKEDASKKQNNEVIESDSNIFGASIQDITTEDDLPALRAKKVIDMMNRAYNLIYGTNHTGEDLEERDKREVDSILEDLQSMGYSGKDIGQLSDDAEYYEGCEVIAPYYSIDNGERSQWQYIITGNIEAARAFKADFHDEGTEYSVDGTNPGWVQDEFENWIEENGYEFDPTDPDENVISIFNTHLQDLATVNYTEDTRQYQADIEYYGARGMTSTLDRYSSRNILGEYNIRGIKIQGEVYAKEADNKVKKLFINQQAVPEN